MAQEPIKPVAIGTASVGAKPAPTTTPVTKFWQSPNFQSVIQSLKKTPAPTLKGGVLGAVGQPQPQAPWWDKLKSFATGRAQQLDKQLTPIYPTTIQIKDKTTIEPTLLLEDKGVKGTPVEILRPIQRAEEKILGADRIEKLLADYASGVPIGAIFSARSQDLYNKIPKSETGLVTDFDLDLQFRDRLYFDQVGGKITGKQTDYPLFWDKNGSLSINKEIDSDRPAYMNLDFASEVFNFLTSYPLYVIGNDELLRRKLLDIKYEEVTPEALKESLYGGEAEEGTTVWFPGVNAREEALTYSDKSILWQLGGVDAWQKEIASGLMHEEATIPRVLGAIWAGGRVGLGVIANYLNDAGVVLLNAINPNRVKNLREQHEWELKKLAGGDEEVLRDIHKMRKGLLGKREHLGDVADAMEELVETWDEKKKEYYKAAASVLENVWDVITHKPKYIEDYQNDAARLAAAANMHNLAYEQYKNGELETALTTLTTAYELESQTGIKDPNFSWSWLAYPERRQQFFVAKGLAELQGGNPLTGFETRQLREKFEKPGVEVVAEFAFDVLDVVSNIPVGQLASKLPEGQLTHGLRTYVPGFEKMDTMEFMIRGGRGAIQYASDLVKVSNNPSIIAAVDFLGKFNGISLWSKKQAAKVMGQDVDYLIGRIYGGEGFVGSGSRLNKLADLGEDIANLKAAGKNTDEITSILQESGKYPPRFISKQRVEIASKMVDYYNPLTNLGDAEKLDWKDLFNSTFDDLVEIRADKLINMDEIAQINTKAATGEISIEIAKAMTDDVYARALEQARSSIRYADISAAIGRKFHDKIVADNLAWTGSKIMNDHLTGVAGKVMGHNVQAVFDTVSNFWYRTFSRWVNNILLIKPAFYGVYQPVENMLFYSFARGKNVAGGIIDFHKLSPELIERVLDLPAGARRGLDPIAFSLTRNEVTTLLDFLKENPKSWIATPGTFSQLFSKNWKQKWSDWLKDIKGADNLGAAVWRGKDIAFTPIEVLGKSGADLTSINETLTQAMVADAQYLKNYEAVNNAVLMRTLDDIDDVLRAKGFSDEAIDIQKYIVENNWNRSRGSSKTFEQLSGSKSVTSWIPDEIRQKIKNTGLSPQDQDVFLRKVDSDLNDYVTRLKANGQEITPKKIDDFFAEYKKVVTFEINEIVNPEGINGFANFPNQATIRPVSNNTRVLLDEIQDGTIRKSFKEKIQDQTLQQIFDDNGIDIAKKSVEQASNELYSSLRPSSKKYQITDDDLLRKINELPDDTARTVHAGEGEKMQFSQDFEKMANSNTWYDLPEFERQRLIKEYEISTPELEEMHAISNKYRNARGEVQGIVENLDENIAGMDAQIKGMKGNVPDELLQQRAGAVERRHALANMQETIGQQYSRMNDYLNTVYPGYLITKDRKAKKIAYAELNKLKTDYITNAGNALDDFVTGIKAGQEVTIPSFRNMINWWGIDLAVDDAGRVIRMDILDSATGTRKSYATLFGASGEPVLHPYLSRFIDDSFTGIKSQEILEASLTTSRADLFEMKKRAVNAEPIMMKVSPEDAAKQANEFFHSYVDGTNFNAEKTIREHLEVALGKSIDDLTYDDVMEQIRKQVGGRKDEAAKILQELQQDLTHRVDNYVHNYLVGDEVISSPIVHDMLEPEILAWVEHKVANASQHEALQRLLDDWRTIARKLNKKIVKDIDVAVEATQVAAKKLAQMEDALWNGGMIDDLVFVQEGAIPYMRQRMRVPNETVIDQFARSFVPFWMFSTRGGAAWFRIAVEHPELVAAYARIIKFSRTLAYERGLTNRKGEQLPSLIGKLPLFNIAGSEHWVALDSAIPFFRYFFTPNRVSQFDYDERDLGGLEVGINNIRNRAQLHGFGMSPMLDLILTAFGYTDPYSTWGTGQKVLYYGTSLIVPPDLLPPNAWRWLMGKLDKITGAELPDTGYSRLKWFHFLVEDAISKEYYIRIKDAPSQEEKYRLNEELERVLREREGNYIYDEAVATVEQTDYFKQLAGWFTGMYSKAISPAQAELTALQNSINLTRASIADEVLAQTFYPYMNSEQIYGYYNDFRYNSPMGRLYSVRNAFSWVVDPQTGEPIYGEERIKQITANIDKEVQTRGFYEQLDIIYSEYRDTVRAHPVGSEYRDPLLEEARKKLWEERAVLETSIAYALVDRDWTLGYKPESLIFNHYRDAWWYFLRATYPYRDYENDEKYEVWKEREESWLKNLPKLAQELAPIFNINFINKMPNKFGEQDTSGIVQRLVSETGDAGYKAWQLEKDDIDDAIVNAWRSLFLDKFYATIDGLSGEQYMYAREQFLEKNPKPTHEDIINEVKAIYGDKFLREDIRRALLTPDETKRDVLGLQEYQELGRTNLESLYSEAFDLLGWVPSNMKSELKKAMIQIGGNPTLIEEFYDISSAKYITSHRSFESEDAFEKFVEDLRKAVMLIGVEPLQGQQLAVRAYADEMDDKFKKMVEVELGVGFWDIYYEYVGLETSTLQRTWRKEYPENWKRIQQYYTMKDTYAKMNPEWAEFYVYKSSSGGGGGGYSRSGGGGSTKKATVTPTGAFIPLGRRSTTDSRELLDTKKLGSGGVSGMPKWSADLWDKTSVVLREEIFNEAEYNQPLSEAAIGYLQRLAERYPEFADQINAYLEAAEVEGG